LQSGVEAEYYTGNDNDPQAPDARIGAAVARSLGVPHELRLQPHADKDYGEEFLIENWERLSKNAVRQSDGMTNTYSGVAALPAFRGRKTAFPLHLYGSGGEIARGYLTKERYYTSLHTRDSVQRHLLTVRFAKQYARPEAMDLVKGHLHQFVDEALAEGFRVIDLPTLFDTYEMVRRWAAAAFMLRMSRLVVYAPLCEGDFIKATFSISALDRYSEHLHYELIKQLRADLHALPYEKPWLSRSSARNLATFWIQRITGRGTKRLHSDNRVVRGQHRSEVLEAKRLYIKALCLDQKSSPLWDLIDREKFAQVMADEASPAERQRDYEHISRIYTLFQYAALQE
ncbi:MAG: hypothetical protein M3120_02165, partial [Pseudomonadota bacterium]|nr:hypothetical protein [Pseudomonadota bacterium]